MKPSSVMLLSSFSICLHLFLFFTLIFPPCKASSSLGNETDHFSMLKFKESISEDPHHILDSWNSSTHLCNWHGITCGRKHRRVTELRLDGQELRGSITPHIGNLSFLRVIHLDDNNFHGEIPQGLGRLFRLQVLHLSNNTLSGKFPVNITSCSKLRYLDLPGNNLTGKIPMEIGYLHNLEILYLYENKFSGQIPMSIWNLSSLIVLDVAGNNNLEGSIPEDIGRLKNLKVFAVGGNKFSGAIPSALYNLSSLTDIQLVINQFNGSLPTNMFINLPNLEWFTIGSNQFSGHIPTSLANATMLGVISLGQNNLVGKIPNLGNLYDLSLLEFSYNSLGSNSSKDWEFLYSLSNCSKLERLHIEHNNFGGQLPNTIGNLSAHLTEFVLGRNQICGRIPAAFGNLINLKLLDMDKNYLTGVIPITFGNFQKMQKLYLGENKFSGNIHFIGNLTQLFHLDLYNNMFEGKVPPSIENCKSLQVLVLSHNNFSGTIPIQLITLSSLSILLDLSHNSFGGDLPDEVGNLKNIGQLDVSHNHLTGIIRQTIGECQSLEYLFLQENFFQETIPLSLASLKGLRYLDLSKNNLSGSIPKDLQDIAKLEYLNVSFNMLDGEVPSKGVFGNASAISLMGNNRLCGGISKLELPPCPIKSIGQRKHQNFKLIVSICCVIAFLLLASVVAIYHRRKRNKKSSLSSPTNDMVSRVSYQSLHNATDGFSINNLIGYGSFGSVYEGSFQSQEVVAIKVINLQMRGAHKSFVNECNALRNAKHRNLVKIITCCSSIDYKGHEFKALVYEYMENGNLENWLYPRIENPDHPRILLLDQIINVIINIVSALNYLHYEYGRPLIHCDLKPSNVLLDGDMVAHLGDFGLARLLSTVEVVSNKQSSTISIKGTVGYVPPEYGMGSQPSIQGDMYSFGILVLEMLSKRRPTEDMFTDGHNLQTYVKLAFPNKLLEVVSPTILPRELEHVVGASGDLSENMMQIHHNVEKCLRSLFEVGLTCSMESPHERMSAIDVTRQLNSIKSLLPLW